MELIPYEIQKYNTILIFRGALKMFLFSKYINKGPLFFIDLFILL